MVHCGTTIIVTTTERRDDITFTQVMTW